MTEDKISVVRSNLDTLDIAFKLEGPGFCEKQDNSLSGGEIFLIILAVVIVIIFALWLAVLIFNLVKGKRGLQALPITGLFKKKESQPFNQF